jgi:tRNA (guanine26-N2/guanine27-N2)-dimethyltransferase
MTLDRDLNVALVASAMRGRTGGVGLDLLAATGVRGLRLLVETPVFSRFVLSDRNPEALPVLAANAWPYADRGARVVRLDARRSGVKGPFDYVDLDPFGTPVPYLDAVFPLVTSGGLLGVTATDMPVLTGVSKGAAERRYGGRPIRGRLGPEGGLRLLLAELARRARSAGRSIQPIAGYIHDHHVRALVRVGPPSPEPDPVETLDPGTFEGPRLPPGPPYGPMWLGPLFDPGTIAQLEPPRDAGRPREVARWIAEFREEAAVPVPFYYESNELARWRSLASPPAPDDVVQTLRAMGFAAGRTHARDGAFRTTAPRAIVEEIAVERSPSPRTTGSSRSSARP